MNYDSKHIDMVEPKKGYNAVADQYGAYHKHLSDFDKLFFLRLLPRETKNLEVIDLGAGDGRIYSLLGKYPFKSYTACDIAEGLLKKHPGKNVTKTVCDLESVLPFPDESFDLAFSFFVLEHLKDLEHFFNELYRILKTGGIALIGYFLQRREFVRKKDKDYFKIQLFNYRIQDIEKIAKEAFFDVKIHPIQEKGYVIGWDIELKK